MSTVKTIFIIVLAILSGACADTKSENAIRLNTSVNESDSELFFSDDVKVEICTPSSEHKIYESLWAGRDKNEFKDNLAAVVKAEITSLSEVKISYYFEDNLCTTYKTLYTIRIKENLWDKVNNSEAIVAVPDSSYRDNYDIPNFKIGDEVVFFLRDATLLENDSLDLKSYTDYYVSSPADIAPCESDNIYVDGIFARVNDRYIISPYNIDEKPRLVEENNIASISSYTDMTKVIITKEDFCSRLISLMNE